MRLPALTLPLLIVTAPLAHAADPAAVEAAFKSAASQWLILRSCTAPTTTAQTDLSPLLRHEYDQALTRVQEAGLDTAPYARFAPEQQIVPDSTTLGELRQLCADWQTVHFNFSRYMGAVELRDQLDAALAAPPPAD
ncbi:MAG: hypothetical protein Q4G25_08640 [Paracoccus sp. (in: a-proteobacteria)]|nr:hypothetical protein [Paracoccus sp. (in: a-proteobacteria)]